MDPSGTPIFSGIWEWNLIKELIDEQAKKLGIAVDADPRTISEILNKKAPDCAKDLYNDLKKDAPEMIAYETERRRTFEADNYTIWKEAFDLIEIQLKMNCEIIGRFNSEVGPLIVKEERPLFSAISALHGNGCLVAQEIFALMRAGFASAALARWRKLYEIEITALYLEQNGKGVGNDLATSYLDYSIVEKYKSVKLYENPEVFENHSKRLGYEPYPKDDIDALKALYNKLRDTKGSGFCQDYGWAHSESMKEPTLITLARSVKLGHLYPYYQLANDAVHSGPGSIFWNISLPVNSGNAVLIGPTGYGMADPGQLLTLSLNRLNFALLALHPSLVAREIMIINNWLTDEIMESLKNINNIVDSEGGTIDQQ